MCTFQTLIGEIMSHVSFLFFLALLDECIVWALDDGLGYHDPTIVFHNLETEKKEN